MADPLQSVRSDRNRDHWLFFYVFAAGTIAIFLMHLLRLPQLMVTGFTVLLMVGYMAFELHSGDYAYREERLGDDLYYLGLLFTLVSLALSLHLFGGRSTLRADMLDELIANFGIAIFTTIFGLFFRVGLYKWRGDELEEPELRAQIDLALAAGQLRAQLLSAVEDMNSFRLAVAQSIAELIKDGTGKISAAIREGIGGVRDQAAAARDAAEQSLGGLSVVLDKLNEEAGRLNVELAQLWKRIQNIEAPSDLLQRELAPTLKILARHARAVEKITAGEEERSRHLEEALGMIGGFTRQAEEQVHRMTKDAEGLANLGPRFQNAGHEIEKLVAAVTGAYGQLASGTHGLSETLQRLTSEVDVNLELVKKNRAVLDEEVAKSREAVTKVHAALVSMTSLIVDRLGNGGN